MKRRPKIPTGRNVYGVYAMWLNWAIACGSIVLCLMLAMVQIPRVHFPLVCFGMCLLLYGRVRYNRSSNRSQCDLLSFIMARAMLISGLIMFVINLMHKRHVIDLIVTNVNLINHNLPFIVALVIFPVVMVVCGWAMIRGLNSQFCTDCIRQNGEQSERGFLGQFYAHEAQYMVRMMFVFSALFTVEAYLYYGLLYLNSSLTGRDKFFYDIAPSIILVGSVIYMAIRLGGVYQFFSINLGEVNASPGVVTRVRFMVIRGEKMCLKVPDITADIDLQELTIDNPVQLVLRKRSEVDTDTARTFFTNLTGLTDFKLRFLYSNTLETNDSGLYFFLVTLPDDQPVPPREALDGEWFTLKEVNEMLLAHSLDPLLATEIKRLYRMTMTWKQYDLEGRRRYAIRSYKPHFKLSDLTTADIDFNDFRWLYVAENNQDKPLFLLRRFWGRHVSGVSKGLQNRQ